jgi:uncharacterized protein YdcH (DUF465 family)
MNPIVSIYKLMGNNVSMNLSNADETGNSPQMMDLFNSLKTEITELKNDNVNFKNEITELKNDNVNFKNEITPLNGKISFLEKECLYSKLENNAIQLLNYKKRIYAVDDMIENNNVFITLSDIQLTDIQFTMTEFKVRYKALLDNRNEETHPFGKNDYKPEDLLHKSIVLIKEMDFSTVDKNSHVYFAKLVIENYSAVTDSLIDSTNKYQKK